MLKTLTEAMQIVIDQINSITIDPSAANENCYAVLIKIQCLLQKILHNIIKGVNMDEIREDDRHCK